MDSSFVNDFDKVIENNINVVLEEQTTENETDAVLFQLNEGNNNISSSGRKRYRKPQNWKVQEANKKRNLGQEYISYSTKKVVQARRMKESCEKLHNCRTKCHLKISENQRQLIFQNFWKLGNHNKHMDFLAKHVKKEQKKVNTVGEKNSRRQFTMNYYFTVRESFIKVCKTFFLNTLNITDIWIRTVMNKLNKNEIGIGSPDNRGKITTKDPNV